MSNREPTKMRRHKNLIKQLHMLPHDFRTRLNSTELRDVGKEFIKSVNNSEKKGSLRNASLTPEEFEVVMQNLGFEDMPMLQRVFQIFDLDGNGTIDYHELVCCVDLLLRGHGEETLRFCFSLYDQDDSGYISEFELFNVLQMCGKSMMYEEFGGSIKNGYLGAMRKLYRSIDKDSDGRISYNEFVSGMNDHPILLKALLEPGAHESTEEGDGEEPSEGI